MNEKTRAVLDTFTELNTVPRQSKHEEQIRAWIAARAEAHGFAHRVDDAGNIIVSVPASAGMESAPTIVLQGHMDMVCEKRPEVEHDFSRDPIRHVTDGDWLRADGTTLGADNGIAVALALRLAEDPDVAHPKLELLFTVDEETGLTGALELPENSLEGRMLVNLDSEEDDTLIVGCAGGRNTTVRLPVSREDPGDGALLEVRIGGLSGGHSGMDIGRNLGNANRLLARALSAARDIAPVRILTLSGGNAHNAIPRDAVATVSVPPEAEAKVRERLGELGVVFAAEQRREDPNLSLSVDAAAPGTAAPGTAVPGTAAAPAAGAVAPADSGRIIDLLLALPHGVFRMSDDIDGLVETSANVATVSLEKDELSVLVSLRSSVPSQLDAESEVIAAAVRLAGGTVSFGSEYPSWTPNMDSALLARARQVFTEVVGEEPNVAAIHAGLEAGVIGAKHAGMDMVSLGPTIEGAHTPEERLRIPSVERVWTVMVALLGSLT